MSFVSIAVETLKIAADLIEILSKDTEHKEKAQEIIDAFKNAEIILPEHEDTNNKIE